MTSKIYVPMFSQPGVDPFPYISNICRQEHMGVVLTARHKNACVPHLRLLKGLVHLDQDKTFWGWIDEKTGGITQRIGLIPC